MHRLIAVLARRSLVLAVALTALSGLAAAQSFPLKASTDGIGYTTNPRGNKPIGGGSTCKSGWTCDVEGSSTQQSELNGSIVTIQRLSGDGWATVRKTFSSEANRSMRTCIQSTVGDATGWASAGAYITDGDWTAGYVSYTQTTHAQSNDYGVFDRNSTTPTVLPLNASKPCGGFKYVAATNTLTLWLGDTMTTGWVLLGTSTAREYDAGNYGAYAFPSVPAATGGVAVDIDDSDYTFVDEGSGGDTLPTYSPDITKYSCANPRPQYSSGIWTAGSYYTAYKSLTGCEPDLILVVSAYTTQTTWEQVNQGAISQSALPTVLAQIPDETTLVWLWCPVPRNASLDNYYGRGPELWAEIAAGDHDDHIQAGIISLRTYLAGQGRDPANTVLRLCHEADGFWYQWGLAGVTAAEFKAGWARMVAIFRTEIPGIKIDFSPAKYNIGYRMQVPGQSCSIGCVQIYDFPGLPNGYAYEDWTPDADDYDFISPAGHDGDPRVRTQTNFDQHMVPSSARRHGFQAAIDKSIADNRHLTFLEWGPYTHRSDEAANYAGSDWTPSSTDPPTAASILFFMQQMHTLFHRHRDRIKYITIFNASYSTVFTGNSSPHLGTVVPMSSTPYGQYYINEIERGTVPPWFPGNPPPP